MYIAYEQDRNRQPSAWKRMAGININKLKEAMRAFPTTTWTVAKYVGTWREEKICEAIQDPTQVEADQVDEYIVTASGQVRKK